jgi:ferrous-iron efflux pump FieF
MPWSTLGSLVTYFGVRYADRPPDRRHRFGHEKGEAVAEVGPASVLEIVAGGDEAV